MNSTLHIISVFFVNIQKICFFVPNSIAISFHYQTGTAYILPANKQWRIFIEDTSLINFAFAEFFRQKVCSILYWRRWPLKVSKGGCLISDVVFRSEMPLHSCSVHFVPEFLEWNDRNWTCPNEIRCLPGCFSIATLISTISYLKRSILWLKLSRKFIHYLNH